MVLPIFILMDLQKYMKGTTRISQEIDKNLRPLQVIYHTVYSVGTNISDLKASLEGHLVGHRK